ncbi:hypothetical protein vseg_018818 [Gypsophila vaccaria]
MDHHRRHHHHRINHPHPHPHHHHNHLPPAHPLPPPPFPPPPPPSSSYHRRHHHPPMIQVRDVVDDFPSSSAIDRPRFDFVHPRVSPISPIFHSHVDFRDCLSPPPPPPPSLPPPFVDRFSRDVVSPRYMEEFDVERCFRFGEDRRKFGVVDRDELHRPSFYEDEIRRSFGVVHREEFGRARFYDGENMGNINFGVVDREELDRARFYDERRSMDVVKRDDLHRNVVYDDWRSMDDFEREELLRCRIDERRRVMDDLEREELLRHRSMVFRDELVYDRIGDERRVMSDRLLHDRYRSEVILGGNGFVGGEVVHNPVPMSMNFVRRGGFDLRSSDVVNPPFEFRARDIEGEERFTEFGEQQRKFGLRAERGTRERLNAREDFGECPYSSRKKSAFLRLQPAAQHTSSLRTTPSPHKRKGTDIGSSGHRLSETEVGSSVDLDVSFKANALVTKVVIDSPSSSKVDTKIVNESPLRAIRSKKRGTNSPVPKKEEKQSDDQVRVSPILMKVGIRKVAEVPDSSSKSSSSGCSSLSAGDNTCSAVSPEGEAWSEGDNRDDVCNVSLPSIVRRKRKAVNLISCFSASVPSNLDAGVDVDNLLSSPSGGSISDAPGSLKPGSVQDEPDMSNMGDVTISVEKCSSEVDFKKGGGQDQGSALVTSVGDNVGNIDVCYAHMDLQDSLVMTNSMTCDVNICRPDSLSSKYDIFGEQCREVPRDGDGDDNESVRHPVNETKLPYSQSVAVWDGDILSTDCMKITPISGNKVTNDIQEHQSPSAGSILVNDESRKRRKLSQEPCLSVGGNLGHLAPSSVKEDNLSVDRKRKVGIDVCDAIDPKDNRCNCSKKRKSNPVDSDFIDISVSESCDLCSSANDLKSMPRGNSYSVNFSEQAAGVHNSSNDLVPSEDVVAEAANNLQIVIDALGDCSKAEVQQRVSHSLVDEIAQSSYMVESGYKVDVDVDVDGDDDDDDDDDDEDLIVPFKCQGNKLIRSDSEAEKGKVCQNSDEHCIQPNHSVDSNAEPLVTGTECESIITVELNFATQSDCPGLCAEFTQDLGTSKPAMLNKSSKLKSLSVSATSDLVIRGDAKKSESLKSVRAFIPQSNIVCGSFQKNVKRVNSAAPSNLPFTQKAAPISSKYANKGVSISSSTSRQFSWRNELTHGKTSLSSAQAYPVTAFSKKSVAPIPAKPRTWHRTPTSSTTIVKKPSPSTTPPQRPPHGKSSKVRDTCYVRKGNSLVRNSASSTTALGPHANNVCIIQEKPIDLNGNGAVKGSVANNFTESSDCLITGGRHAPIEMAKKSPLSSIEKTSEVAHIGQRTSPLQVDRSEGMDNRVSLQTTEIALGLLGDAEIVLDRSEDAGNLSDGAAQASNVKKVVYVKRKANQLIAASPSPELSGQHMDKKLGLSSDNSYYKRRKHQLIRASSESNIQKMDSAADGSSNLRVQRASNVYSRRSASKRPSSRVKSSKVSLVWKLGDAKSSDKVSAPSRSKQLLSHLLPWKRTTYRRTVWRASASSSSCSSLNKPRKSLTSRNQAVVYVRSGRGFSLKRSKVISLAGSLKWSKSMEKRSKKIDAEATLAVAASDSLAKQKTGVSGVSPETGIKKLPSHKSVSGLKLHRGERIFRVGLFRYRMDSSRRTLQRIADEEAPDSTTSKTEKHVNKSYMPKRLLIGSNEYVRIGNGNQLVRDPKRRTRILASEKVRWSLHTARSRLAKKRKFCQFFTRFGQCNKSEGKCPYIHDSSKISVCTKFLKGLCVDPNCKLTHKVIPDRMPDCSFFLQGSCSNESCPYRHVNVEPTASICESFLRGYCSEGNKCLKKHSYLCPEIEATGSCPQGSKCKLYHPKKGVSKKGKLAEDQRNIRGRYFDPGLSVTISEPNTEAATLEEEVAPKNNGVVSEGGDLGDYISLDVSDDEQEESIYPTSEATCLSDFVAPVNSDALSRGGLTDNINLDNKARDNEFLNKEVMYLSEFEALTYLSDDVDELAKPLCIWDTQSGIF